MIWGIEGAGERGRETGGGGGGGGLFDSLRRWGKLGGKGRGDGRSIQELSGKGGQGRGKHCSIGRGSGTRIGKRIVLIFGGSRFLGIYISNTISGLIVFPMKTDVIIDLFPTPSLC